MPVIYIIRHGQSEFNIKTPPVISGQSINVKLTEIGKQQAQQLGRYLLNNKITFDYCFCSPAERAKQTAEIISNVLHNNANNIVFNHNLLEIGQGEWEGELLLNTIYKNKKDIKKFWNYAAPGGGETLIQVENRISNFWKNDILEMANNSKIMIISHNTAIKCLLKNIIGLSKKGFNSIKLQNTSLSIIEVENKSITSFSINTQPPYKSE